MSSIIPIRFPSSQEMNAKLSTNPDFVQYGAIITPLVNHYAGKIATDEQIGMTARKLI